MTYTAIYPLRANGKVYGVGESIPPTLKGVDFDSLVSKGYIAKSEENLPQPLKTNTKRKPIIKEIN